MFVVAGTPDIAAGSGWELRLEYVNTDYVLHAVASRWEPRSFQTPAVSTFGPKLRREQLLESHWAHFPSTLLALPGRFWSEFSHRLSVDGKFRKSPNLTDANRVPPTYNVFVTPTLYQISTATIVNFTGYAIPPPVTITNGLPFQENRSVVILQNYFCQQRRPKAALSIVLSVAVADYALVVGGDTCRFDCIKN